MNTKFHVAFFATAMLFCACQDDTLGEDGGDSSNSGNSSSNIAVATISIGGDTSDAEQTKVSLNPSESASFFWASQEYFTAIDMTDDYHDDISGKFNTMYANINTVTNSAWFTFTMPIAEMDLEKDGDTGIVNFYAYTPDRDYNNRYNDMIKLAHEKGDEESYNGDYLLLNYPMNRHFNIDIVGESMSDSYYLYGRYLPFVAVPLRNKSVTWNLYDEATQQATGLLGVANFSSADKLNFAPIFHTVMVRIYPYQDAADDDSTWVGDFVDSEKMSVHKSVTTITLGDGNTFRGGDLLDMSKMVYSSFIPYMIENARVDLDGTDTEFVDSDGDAVSKFPDSDTISTTMLYYDITADSIYQNKYYYGNEAYDEPKSSDATTSTLDNRRADGADYMVIPVIATRTNDVVTAFTITVEFYGLDENGEDKLLLTITRSITDSSDTRDYWYYGSQSIVRLYEDPTAMDKPEGDTTYGEFTYYYK